MLIDLNLDFIFQPAADLDCGGALFGLEVILYSVFSESPQFLEAAFAGRNFCLVCLLPQESQSHDRLGRRIEAKQQRPLGFYRQIAQRIRAENPGK